MGKQKITLLEQYVIDEVLRRRVAKGYSQRDLALRVELSPAFISDVENPNRRAKYNLAHLNRLAFALGCSPRELLPNDSYKD